MKQDHSRVKRPLPDFLLGFGLLLPKGNISVSEDPADMSAFDKTSLVSPETLNAHLLCSLANVRIVWIDVIAPHLEFDKETNTLFLFSYPSFCASNLASDRGTNIPKMIYHCASDDDDPPQWASGDEITSFLSGSPVVLPIVIRTEQEVKVIVSISEDTTWRADRGPRWFTISTL